MWPVWWSSHCDGEVFTCGRKEYSRLGLGKDTEEPNLPTQVEGQRLKVFKMKRDIGMANQQEHPFSNGGI